MKAVEKTILNGNPKYILRNATNSFHSLYLPLTFRPCRSISLQKYAHMHGNIIPMIN
jgi:hypothetical protein